MNPCDVTYYCPASGDVECCGEHGGFGTCCDAPEDHVPQPPITPSEESA